MHMHAHTHAQTHRHTHVHAYVHMQSRSNTAIVRQSHRLIVHQVVCMRVCVRMRTRVYTHTPVRVHMPDDLLTKTLVSSVQCDQC